MREGISNTYVTSSASTVYPSHCVYLDFSSGPVRVTNNHVDITMSDDFGGGTYSAVGGFGTINAVQETEELSAKSLELELNGIPQESISLALLDQYRGRQMCVYLLLHDEDFTVFEKTILFRGRMDTMTINEGTDRATIKLVCESRLIELQRPRDRRYTNEEQKRLYPTDKGLEYIAASVTQDFWWGNAAPGGASVSQGGNSGGGSNSQALYNGQPYSRENHP